MSTAAGIPRRLPIQVLNQSRHCLISVIRRELVLLMWHGRRQRMDTLFSDLIQLILSLFASTIISWADSNPM